MAAADLAAIASLTCQRVQTLVVGKSGKNWMDVLKAIRDNDLDGHQLAPHMDSPASLQDFLKADWDCSIPAGIAKVLHGLICAAAGDGGGGSGGGVSAGARGRGAGSAGAL
jgi:hypothetical protein